jgi:hypothetical protein
MNIAELIKKIETMDYPQHLDKGYEGSCPCFYYNPTVEGKRLVIHGHCWRTTVNSVIGGCKCEYNGVHISGKLPKKDLLKIGKAFKKQLDAQKWYSEWDLVIDKLGKD